MSADPALKTDSSPSPAADAIASAAPFSELPRQVISALADMSSARAYAAGETIFAMGQFDGSEFLIVQSGRIKASHADPKTGAMIFEEAAQGESFGLALAIAGGETRHSAGVTVTAEKDSEIVAVDSETLREMASQRPSLARALMLHFARRLLGETQPSEDGSPERRVYAALSSYVERDAVSGEWRISRMPKHRELADRADVDEAAAANAVARLIQTGVARRNYPGLIIADISQLSRLAR